MTTMHTTARVGPDGKLTVTVPMDASDAGKEVNVTISPASDPTQVSLEEWLKVIEETAGSIPDFEVPSEAMIEPIPTLDKPE